MEWVDGLEKALVVVLTGFVTGGIAATVFLAWALRRGGSPAAQGRRVLAYIVASTLAVIGMVFWLFVVPWL